MRQHIRNDCTARLSEISLAALQLHGSGAVSLYRAVASRQSVCDPCEVPAAAAIAAPPAQVDDHVDLDGIDDDLHVASHAGHTSAHVTGAESSVLEKIASYLS